MTLFPEILHNISEDLVEMNSVTSLTRLVLPAFCIYVENVVSQKCNRTFWLFNLNRGQEKNALVVLKVNCQHELKFKYSHYKKTEFELEIYTLVVSKNINIVTL